VVEVLHAPHPKALSLLLGLGEHLCTKKEELSVREGREHTRKAGESAHTKLNPHVPSSLATTATERTHCDAAACALQRCRCSRREGTLRAHRRGFGTRWARAEPAFLIYQADAKKGRESRDRRPRGKNRRAGTLSGNTGSRFHPRRALQGRSERAGGAGQGWIVIPIKL
jgi:hypothetical protein